MFSKCQHRTLVQLVQNKPLQCVHMNLLIVIESHCEAGECPVFLRKLAGQSSELVSQK